jgi:GT2 family glycosyltransferase
VVIALHEDMPESNVHALARQSADPSTYEVLIVDGWHAPGVADRVERAIHGAAREAAMRVLRIPRAGRAKACNVGIAATTAPVVLLLADDCRPVPELLDRHLALHRTRPEPHVAALGPALFPPELRESPFRRWLDDSGRLFGVSFTRADPSAIAGFFFGANASVKRAFLERVGPFDEAFPHHGWDDFEMGQRLFEAGMEIEYLADAVTYHEHPITLAERRAVMQEAGESAAVFSRTRPLPEPWLSVTRRSHWFLWLRMQRRQAAFLARGDRTSMERYLDARLELDFARGYGRAMADSRGGGRLHRDGPAPSGH